MTLLPGTKLGPYEILAPIGKGGMGEVYRARDTKLDRDVAIKVLPEEFARDEQRLARFEREAKLLASLNHPNIASIYGFESGALVLELVEGPTLAERIAGGAIPVDEAVAIAKQIAEALDAGHEAGVIHRDLKPANVKVKEDGNVKLLDYGLAKALEGDGPGGADAELSQSPTLTRHGTQVGVILGTAAYMSPEQARGKRVDKRADVWAFGVVLYEMLTGRRAFEAEDVSLTLAEVMKSEPDWSALPPELSPTLRTYLMRCFEKDPKHRVRDIGDIRLALDGAFETSAEASTSGVETRVAWPALGFGLVLGGLLAGAAVWSLRPAPTRPIVRFELDMPPGASLDLGRPDNDIAISADGTHAVYAVTVGTDRQFVVRALDELEPTRLDAISNNARGPFVSPDGQWVAFFEDGSEFVKVSTGGGPAVKIGDIPPGGPRGASWGSDDTIVFAKEASGLMRVATDGGSGEPEELTKSDLSQGDHRWPAFLPGAEAVLFTVFGGSFEESQIAVVSLATREWKILLTRGSQPRYASTGHIVYAVEGALHAVGFDRERLELTSSPAPVVQGVVTKATGAAEFAIARDGSLVYVAGPARASARRTLVWRDREGNAEPVPVEPRGYANLRISPDGSAVALYARDEGFDIWIWEFARETMRRFTFVPEVDNAPVWTPDQKHLVFASEREGIRNLFRKAVDGTGGVERLTNSSNPLTPLSISPDGSRVVVWERHPEQENNLSVVSLDGDATVTALITEFNGLNGQLSPDGEWLAYHSNPSGRSEIYVAPFPNVDGGLWQISRDGGTRPLWAPSGRELFYVTFDGRLMSAPVTTGATFTHGKPEVVFESLSTFGLLARTFDISRDGTRFLMIEEAPSDETERPRLIVVQNWTEELKRLVPTEN